MNKTVIAIVIIVVLVLALAYEFNNRVKQLSVDLSSVRRSVPMKGSDIGLDKVDNTHDVDKPISNDQAVVNTAQLALNAAQTDAVASKLARAAFMCSANFYLRKDLETVANNNIDFFPVTQRGSSTVPAKYVVNNIKYKRIYTVDGAWESDLYLPSVTDYDKYTHIYFHCSSSNGFTLHTERSDIQEPTLAVNRGDIAVFVSTGRSGIWTYLGMTDESVFW